jgi:hypothetical protein
MKRTALLLMIFCLPLPCRADEARKPEPPKAWMEPAGVDDEDFTIQGEYTGEHEGKRLGVQIWAQGGGKFEAVSYHGGLPGDGWDGDRSTTTRVTGQRHADEKSARFEKDDIRATVDGRTIQVMNLQGERVMELSRALRQSPTLGAKPPPGAVVLFDGTDATHFPGAKVTPDGLLEQGATSSDKLGDGTWHVEFMLSYMPAARGQGRSNSGVYLQGRYEVQVLDSFALEGKNNECGGIYSIAAPKQNMCFPPLTWQTYDIDFTAAKYDAAGAKIAGARMTVRHNGVVIHENVEVPHTTAAAPVKEENAPGPLYLQNHGNPVRYRNIWFVPK